jgi:hypothetical protein
LSEIKHKLGPSNGGNILIRTDGQPPILIFISGGIDQICKTERERVYGWFKSNFESDAPIDIADAAFNSITENLNSARW